MYDIDGYLISLFYHFVVFKQLEKKLLFFFFVAVKKFGL